MSEEEVKEVVAAFMHSKWCEAVSEVWEGVGPILDAGSSNIASRSLRGAAREEEIEAAKMKMRLGSLRYGVFEEAMEHDRETARRWAEELVTHLRWRGVKLESAPLPGGDPPS